MKKFILAVLVGLMVIASASFAAAEVTVGGELEVRYDLWYNFNGTGGGIKSQNFFADRVLLNVDAKITEGLEAFVELDTLGIPDERVWGVNGTNGSVVSAVNFQGNTVAVRQAWVNFMIPGIPVGLKVGHQPLALGHGISLDTHRLGTDAILLYSKPIDQLLIAGVYSKVVENSSELPGNFTGAEHHDADVYAALANYTFIPNNTVGVNYLFVNDNATGGGIAKFRLHNIGLAADGVVGPVNYKAEFDYQDVNGSAGGEDFGVSHGWAAMLGAGAKVSIVNIGMEVAYGTGTERTRTAGSRTYLSPYGETSYNYAFLYNDKLGQSAGFAGGGLGLGDGTGGFGLANTGYVKITAGLNPMERLSIDTAVLYLRASARDARTDDTANSRDLGWEIDAHAGYKIYDNLNLDVTGGLFLPGAWYDGLNQQKTSTVYGLETKLSCKF